MSYKKHTALYAFALALLLAGLWAPATWAKDKGWELIIDEGFHSMAMSVAVLPDKSVLVGGTTCRKQPKALIWNAWLKRFDAQGKLIWSKGFDNGPSDIGQIYVLDSGDFVVYGHVRKRSEKKCKGGITPVYTWFAKMNAAGEIIWERRLDRKKSNETYAFTAVPNGDLFVVGDIVNSRCEKKASLVWLDRDGRVKRSVEIGRKAGGFWFHSVAKLTDGNFLINATLAVGRGADAKYYRSLIKMSAEGHIIWEKDLRPGLEMNKGAAIGINDGYFVLAGYEKQLDAGPEKMIIGWLSKIGPEGKIIWTKTFPLGIRYGYTGPFLGLPNGELVLADEGSYWSTSDHNAALTQLTAEGEVVSRAKFPVKDFSSIRALAYSPDDSILAVGFRSRSPKSPLAQWIIKIPLPLAGGK